MVAFRPHSPLTIALLVAGALGLTHALALSGQGAVVEIPIRGTIDQGTAKLVERSAEQAARSSAAAIIVDVDSSGGLDRAAFQIHDALLASRIPTISFVSAHAEGAAALVALSARKLIMAPGADIGNAEPIPAAAKSVASLRAEFESTAARTHRDPNIAAAMVDKSIELPEYKKDNSVLTLSTEDALRAHVADGTAASLSSLIAQNNLSSDSVQIARPSFGENIAHFATSPIVSALLLTLGLLGLLIEMQTLHGLAGAVGIGALAVFFGSHVYAGFSGGLVIGLALLGLLGLLFELHVAPGHGAPGIVGAIALFFSIVLAFGVGFFFVALQTVAVAVVLTVLLFALATRMFPENAFLHRLTFAGVQGAEYVTSSDFTTLRGRTGSASSFLRPAGVALIDNRSIDVLTAGEFIQAGTPVRVTRVEGARVFVEPIPLPSFKE